MTEQETDNKIDNPQRDWVGVIFEICFSVVLYFVTAFLFMRYVMRQLPHWFGDFRGPLAIIAPVIGWVVFIRYSKILVPYTKRLLSIVIFTVCAAILSVWLLLYYIWLTKGSY
jgi:hypothetical protein